MLKKLKNKSDIIKLTQNENAYGASPTALKIIAENYINVYRYPDVLQHELKTKLADMYQVSTENIVIGAGSVALMDIAIKALVGRDENVVTAEATFEGYKYMSRVNQRECRLSKLTNNTIDLHKMLELSDQHTKLVFIANPNNPTGTMNTHDELKEFLRAVSPETYVVLDEAYAEYVTDSDYPDSLALQREYSNLIIFRTFSKIYGLAGLRIGYAVSSLEISRLLQTHRTPFSINGLAAEAASASLDDGAYIRKCSSVNSVERTILYDKFIELGYNAVEPKGNFIFIEFPSVEVKMKLHDYLLSHKILVRDVGPFGAELGLRISVGRPDENRRLVYRLEKI